MAARTVTRYRCTECSAESLKWLGRCGSCQAWGTVEELASRPTGGGFGGRAGSVARPVSAAALPITEIPADSARSWPSGLSEFDRVLGGGLVPGGVVLLAGEPGVGKS